MRLVEQTGHIDSTPYKLMLKTLNYIEIGMDGGAEVFFLLVRKFKHGIKLVAY